LGRRGVRRRKEDPGWTRATFFATLGRLLLEAVDKAREWWRD
jgi:hypothetical protein